ncbi:TolC family protein [Massilia niastensis]|uniref:TolC family protein n=1 Tax=Massilia niastensis TaxID=544911 RepID=UPI00038252DB|nr:TolC family protein [Massilia niastensis]
MHSKRFIVGALVLSAWAFPAAAQDANPAAAPALTLDRAVTLALEANPGLRASALDVAIAGGARRQAGLIPNPEVSFLKEGTERGARTRTVELSQVFELGGKRRARMALAERDSQLAAGALDVARTELRADVSAAYFDALSAQERVRLARTSLDIAAKARVAAEKRVAAGRVSPLEQSRATVAESTSRLELAQAHGELAIALDALAAYWGETRPAARTLAEPAVELPPLPSLDALRAQLGDSPQLRRARLLAAREDAQVGVERSLRMPDLTLVVGRKKEDEIGRSQTVVGVSLPLPLFNRNQGNLHTALSRADKARAGMDAERVRLEQALSAAYRRAQLAREQVRSMREEILPAAQQVFDAAVTGFEAGKFGFLDVLDAQRTLLQSRAQYIQVLHERYRSMTDLDRFVQASADTTTPDRITP